MLAPETTMPSNPEITPSPKFVNINTTNFQPKVSSAVSESPASSVAYQLVTQQSPYISSSPISKLTTISSILPPPTLPPLPKEAPPVSNMEPPAAVSQPVTSSNQSTTVIPTTSTQPVVSSQKEISVTSVNSTKIQQITDNRPSSQILPKLRPPNSPATVVCSSTSSMPSNSSDNSNNTELCQSIKQSIKEGPVTKHIRFLSALILRNLCQNSSVARR